MTEIRDFFKKTDLEAVEKAVFSLPRENCIYQKTVIRKKQDGSFQKENFTKTQAFHENFPCENLENVLTALLENEYKQVHVVTENYFYDGKISKKGKLLSNRTQNNIKNSNDNFDNNRKKKYIIDEENLPEVFRELGVSGADGRILKAKYDKFRQICRFTELIDDVLSKDTKTELNIVDFGCGKSYLTFVVYYYITEILGKKAHITGLDLKESVIENCKKLATKYGYNGLEFLCMDVKDYVPKEKIHMVIALHACDIATDYAINFAVKSGAEYIFSVPCCQKEASKMFKADTFSVFGEYGLIKERFSALVTDTLRAKLLEKYGYSADIVEFIDFENSPKNVLIRAKHKKASANKFKLQKTDEQIELLRKEFGVTITLEKLLAEKA